jgi:hypothetical protein
MTEENNTNQGIQEANNEIVAKSDPMMDGIPSPVKMEGKAAPIAAPKQQVAPVSANGEHTSSRESPKRDISVEAPRDSQPVDVSEDNDPSADEANPSSSETSTPEGEETEELPPEGAEYEQSPEEETEEVEEQVEESQEEIPFEELPPLEQANILLNQIPGKMRLY